MWCIYLERSLCQKKIILMFSKINLKEKIALMCYVPALISFLQFHFQVPSFYFGNVSSVFDSGTTSTHLSSSVLQPYRWYYIITKVTPKATYIISHLRAVWKCNYIWRGPFFTCGCYLLKSQFSPFLFSTVLHQPSLDIIKIVEKQH